MSGPVRIRKLKAVSMNPADLTPDPDASLDPREFALDDGDKPFSVMKSLRDDYQTYADETHRVTAKTFTISSCPLDVRDSLFHLRARTFQAGRPPAIYALTYCALDYGRRALARHPATVALHEAQADLDRATFASRHHRRVVREAAGAAYGDMAAAERRKRWTIRLPEDDLGALKALAGSLAMDAQATAILSLMVTLATQVDDEMDDAREEYARLVVAVMARVEIRARAIDALVREFAEAASVVLMPGQRKNQ